MMRDEMDDLDLNVDDSTVEAHYGGAGYPEKPFDVTLAELVLECARVNPKELPETIKLVDKIKQACKEAGYYKALLIDTIKEKSSDEDYRFQHGTGDSFVFTGDIKKFKDANGFVSSQEWYDRFEDEFLATKKSTVSDQDREAVLDAAKKAAGIL
jgi:hypothetical protein